MWEAAVPGHQTWPLGDRQPGAMIFPSFSGPSAGKMAHITVSLCRVFTSGAGNVRMDTMTLHSSTRFQSLDLLHQENDQGHSVVSVLVHPSLSSLSQGLLRYRVGSLLSSKVHWPVTGAFALLGPSSMEIQARVRRNFLLGE